MSNPEQPGQDFSQWKAPKQESKEIDWIVERGVRFDPDLPEETRTKIMEVLTDRSDKGDWGHFDTDTLTWFEHHGIGSTAVPTPEVLTPYALLSGKKTVEQVAAERKGKDRFLEPGLDPAHVTGATRDTGSQPWDVRLAFESEDAQRQFAEFSSKFSPDPETKRIYVGLKPMEFDAAAGKVRMPKLSGLGYENSPLPPELDGKVSLEAFKITDSWVNLPGTKKPLQFDAWVDKDGMRFERA